ncbi:MAG TPA: MarC family protein [Spirochaetota bacterium]
MSEFLLCFIPVFVAVDPIGNLPIFMALTEGVPAARVRRIVFQSILTALGVSFLFLALGKLILRYLGVSVGDFMVAGGVLLFIISVTGMLFPEKQEISTDHETVGAVPIGVPLVAGPALITTLLLITGDHGYFLSMTATILTLVITGVVFLLSRKIYSILGKSGAKTLSKLASLLLAAIAVMMVRKGIFVLIAEFR